MKKKSAKRPAPFSLRLTFEERKALEVAAGNQPLGTFIRAAIFKGVSIKRSKRTKPRKSIQDQRQLGQALALLGQSELHASLQSLSIAARDGLIAIDEEAETDIKSACVDIQEIRRSLMTALGLRAGNGGA